MNPGVGSGGWRALSALLAFIALSTLPVPASADSTVERVPAHEARVGRARPVIAVVGENAGTELTDFVIPFGILSQSNSAEVFTVATHEGPLRMWPALRIQPDLTIASFDTRFPEGADYVIVPAVMTDEKKPTLLVRWIKAQADRGAVIVSICDGALTVAAAGVFEGRRATGHWATLERRRREYPGTDWRENVRYVADGRAISSAGVSASIPLSLALVEAIAGPDRAHEVSREIGVHDWSSTHDSGKFRLGLGSYSLAIGNWLLPSREIGLGIDQSVDEISLALTADAFSRTYRSRAVTVAGTRGPVRTLHGLTVLPDRIKGEDKLPRQLRPGSGTGPSATALDRTLADIAGMYGRRTASFVALQMEYPRSR
ncbi:MAG TPA: DJ-1/PfpI family protein [Steroidobacteraceae bacterium]|nr:DJ-1/PfpI family protein [Steroidobacteraceae bacterium]